MDRISVVYKTCFSIAADARKKWEVPIQKENLGFRGERERRMGIEVSFYPPDSGSLWSGERRELSQQGPGQKLFYCDLTLYCTHYFIARRQIRCIKNDTSCNRGLISADRFC